MAYGSFFQQDIFPKLRYGIQGRVNPQDLFIAVVGDEIEALCVRFGCAPEINEQALLRAQSNWIDDIGEISLPEGGIPDHLKQSGWLCHWLRKKQPISRIRIVEPEKLPDWFEASYNEMSAFLLGYQLATFHECCAYNYSDQKIVAVMSKASLSPLLKDVALYLDHKNVSPHAIYLIYKSILTMSPLDEAQRGIRP